MDPEPLYVGARRIFDRASRLPAEARDRFVWEQAEGAELRSLVFDLLNSDTTSTIDLIRDASRLAESLVTNALAGAREDAQRQHPARVGAYRIVSRIGEGSTSTVYLALQDSPEREVAVKVLHPGVVSPVRLARFASEARVTGNLNHPMVAHVYDAWTTLEPGGMSPYIVMEHVDGLPIDRHADRAQLSTDDRIRLILDVCAALQHAHQHGIVHCDIKPSNVLVDSHGRAKVLDFGIAQLVAPGPSAGEDGGPRPPLLGTPAYLSPERLGPRATGPDVRADVYATGVMLYELVSGQRPFGDDEPDVATILRRVERGEIGSLRGMVDRDLEAIIMRAMARDVEDRYQGAGALAEDLERFLRREPVRARPASALHRFRRFRQRNGALVTTAGITMALLAGSTALALTFAAGERDARLAERAAQGREIDQAIVANAVVDLLVDDLINPLNTYSPSFSARDVKLEDVIDALDRRLSRDPGPAPISPLREAGIRAALGRMQLTLSQHEAALANLDRAIEIYLDRVGEDNLQTLLARAHRASTLVGLDRVAEASEEIAAVDGLVTAQLGKEHPRAEFVRVRHARMIPLMDASRVLEAAEMLGAVLAQQRRREGIGSPVALGTLYAQAKMLNDAGRRLEARSVLDELLPLVVDHLGETNRLTLEAKRTDLEIRLFTGEDVTSELRTLYGETARTVGSGHILAGMAGRLLAQALSAGGAGEEAERILLDLLNQDLRTSDRIWTRMMLGRVYGEHGRFQECERELVAAHKTAIAAFGERHQITGEARISLTFLYVVSRRPELAINLIEPNVDRRLASETRDSLGLLHNLAMAYHAVGRNADALPCIERVVAVRTRLLGPEEPATVRALQLRDTIRRALEADAEANAQFGQD